MNIFGWPKRPILRSTEQFSQFSDTKSSVSVRNERISSHDTGLCHPTHLLPRFPTEAAQYVIISALQQPLLLSVSILHILQNNCNGNIFQHQNNGMLLDLRGAFPLPEIQSTHDKNGIFLSENLGLWPHPAVLLQDLQAPLGSNSSTEHSQGAKAAFAITLYASLVATEQP